MSAWSWGEIVDTRIAPEGDGTLIYLKSSKIYPVNVLGTAPDQAISQVVFAIENGFGRLTPVP